ncbi:MAG: hypothetical protein ACM33T_15195 [Solirubrobacterales bacterium]
MAVTFIKKGQAAAVPDATAPALTLKGMPRLKRLEAIKNARQFTVMVTPERKAHLKMLAIQQHVTLLTLLNEALAAFFAASPSSIPHSMSPAGGIKLTVKVEPATAEAIRTLAEKHGISHQALLAVALEAL